jgi:hypothetical protein
MFWTSETQPPRATIHPEVSDGVLLAAARAFSQAAGADRRADESRMLAEFAEIVAVPRPSATRCT